MNIRIIWLPVLAVLSLPDILTILNIVWAEIVRLA